MLWVGAPRISYHPSRFGGHEHSGWGDIMVSVCHVIWQSVMWLYMLKPLVISYRPAKFDGQTHSGSGDIMVLVCNMIFQDHLINGLCYVVSGSHSWKSPPCKVLCQWTWWSCRYDGFSLSCDPAWPRDQRVE